MLPVWVVQSVDQTKIFIYLYKVTSLPEMIKTEFNISSESFSLGSKPPDEESLLSFYHPRDYSFFIMKKAIRSLTKIYLFVYKLSATSL